MDWNATMRGMMLGTCLVAVCSGLCQEAKRISYETFKFGRAYFHVVTADMRYADVTAATVHSKRLTRVSELLSPTKPAVAITGTFFAPGCQRPVADVLVDGKLVAKGCRGSVIAVDWFGQVHIFDSAFNQKLDWFGYRYALRGTVRLLRDGVVCPDPRSQKFRDSRIWGRAARTAAGTTRDGRLVLLATTKAVTLSELGKAMKARGVQDAVSLDGGGSTMLYYRGSYIVPVHRKLSNLLVLHERPITQSSAAAYHYSNSLLQTGRGVVKGPSGRW